MGTYDHSLAELQKVYLLFMYTYRTGRLLGEFIYPALAYYISRMQVVY